MRRLRAISSTKTLYAFDYDGTLAKLVQNPSRAGIGSSTRSLLRELAALAPVAVVSGRSIEDLKRLLKTESFRMVGNHGLEGVGAPLVALARARRRCREWKRVLLQAGLDDGIRVEDKIYSLSIHYRVAADKVGARRRIQDAIGRLSPAPRVVMGKAVVNLVMSNAPHKGMALRTLMKCTGSKQAFYVGDDDTDEDVFGLQDSRIFSVRVGLKNASRADHYIRRQSEIDRLLRILIRCHVGSGRVPIGSHSSGRNVALFGVTRQGRDP